jgi:hypothetical protein
LQALAVAGRQFALQLIHDGFQREKTLGFH